MKELKEKVEDFSRKMEEMQLENIQMKRKLKFWEDKQRKKNLVFFGVEEMEQEKNETTYDTVFKVCWEVFNMDVSDGQIEEAYRVGRGLNRPIVVKFKNMLTKEKILYRRKCLKNSNIRLELDYDYETRCRRRLLLPFMWAARKNGHFARLYGDKLNINNEIFDLEFCLENLNQKELESEVIEGNRRDLKMKMRKIINKQMGGRSEISSQGSVAEVSRRNSISSGQSEARAVTTQGMSETASSGRMEADTYDVIERRDAWSQISPSSPCKQQSLKTADNSGRDKMTNQLTAGRVGHRKQVKKVVKKKQARRPEPTKRGSKEDLGSPSTCEGKEGNKEPQNYSLRSWCLRGME